MFQQRVFVLTFVCLVSVSALQTTGCGGTSSSGVPGYSSTEVTGGGVISTIKEWIVGFATAVGEFVFEKAATFAEAVSKAWSAFWGTDKVNGVRVDENDPLKGVFESTLQCKVEWGSTGSDSRSNSLEITLDHPKMVRTSPDSTDWQLAPEERSRIDTLQQQLLKR